MDILEQIWDVVSAFFTAFADGFERWITALFGSSNARYVRKLQPRVAQINALEPNYQGLTDEALRQQTVEFRKRLAKGETLDDLMNEAFAVCREAGRRFLGMRHYDVQLIGGMVLHTGNIAEMVTGEGKTLVATLPAYLNALEGRGVHVVTVNDYLARRDMEWMGSLYMGLGLTVGAIQNNMDSDQRQKAYACDITYGTNNEFGFDYLRDNMRPAARDDDRYPKSVQQSQGPLNFAIIDEVDNILIDEARTPLIISGPAHEDVAKYAKANALARQLTKDAHFEVKEKEHTVGLTDDGVRAAEKLAGVESFYTAGNMEWPHLIDNALKAHHLYKRDVNYVVEDDGEVVIVDEFTGRKMPGRQWCDGLHQAVEAKEGVRIKEETQTLATITLQNFFKLYKKICGMTGTAMTEASEFWKIYKLEVVAIPTNKPLQRLNNPDVIYRSEREKFVAIADEIERHATNGTSSRSADGTEKLGVIQKEEPDAIDFLPKDSRQREAIPREQGQASLSPRAAGARRHRLDRKERANVVAARQAGDQARSAQRQAAQARGRDRGPGRPQGRRHDRHEHGRPRHRHHPRRQSRDMAWAKLQDKYATRLDVPPAEWESLVHEIEQREQMKAEGRQIKDMGGLHIVGTERHEARRIDLQLRGRCGRQGRSGQQPLLSLAGRRSDADLRRRMGQEHSDPPRHEGGGSDRKPDGQPPHRRRQKKVEERNFEQRKNLLEYDEVMDEQRKRVYGYRQRILDGGNCKELVLEMIDSQIEHYLGIFLDRQYGIGNLCQMGRRPARLRTQPQAIRRHRFRRGRSSCQRRSPACRRKPDLRRHRGKHARGRRGGGMELGGPGQAFQHALENELSRQRHPQDRSRPTGGNSDPEIAKRDRKGRSFRRRAISRRGFRRPHRLRLGAA